MSWHLGPLASFDLETTGLDVETDRIVTAAILDIRAQRGAHAADDTARWGFVDRHGWVANPGIDIPAEAAAVHGYTTERARIEGWDAERVVKGIGIVLAERIRGGVPIVVMNAPYDLTMLDRELQRHGLPPLAEQAGREPHVIDPLVLDKKADQYRRGKRNLTALCEAYGVTIKGAHQAAVDALAAAKLAVKIAQCHQSIRMSAADLHAGQREWAAEQADSFRAYLKRQGRPADGVHGHWPMIPRPEAQP